MRKVTAGNEGYLVDLHHCHHTRTHTRPQNPARVVQKAFSWKAPLVAFKSHSTVAAAGRTWLAKMRHYQRTQLVQGKKVQKWKPGLVAYSGS